MPRIMGQSERRRQPYWDSLIRGSGDAGTGSWTPRFPAALATSPIQLFSSAGTGNVSITNMEGAGQFPGDELYNIYAMRVQVYFKDSATQAGLTDFDFYHQAVTQMFWEFKISSKQMFLAPTFFLPAGGGLHGDLGTSTDVYFTNGAPSSQAVLELVKPISLEVRQNFAVNCTIAACGAVNFATSMAARTAGEAWIAFIIDGIHLRDAL